MANKAVKVYEYTKVDGKQRFTPIDTDKKLKISEVSKTAFWYLSWYEGSNKKWKSVGRVALGQAISAAEAKEFHLAGIARGIATPDPAQLNRRFSIAAAMETRRTEIGLSFHKETLVSHNDAFAEFNKWNGNGGPRRQYVDQITRQDLLTFKKHIIDTGRDECTAGSKMMRINAMIKDALKLDHGKGPVTVKDARVSADPVEIYEQDDLDKFFAACNFFQKVLFKTYEKTGFRMKEVMFLEWKDVNFKDRRITVRGKKIVANGKPYEFDVKAESARTIAVPAELIGLLEEWKAVSKSAGLSTDIGDNGPSSDGIQHDHDLIYVWLNPKVVLSLNPTSATWDLGDNPTADIQYLYVGWLKDPAQIPQGVAQRLQTYGITNADYQNMLKADPFANGTPTVDPARFKIVNTTFPYEPPFSQGDPVPTYKFEAKYSSKASSSSDVENEYNVGVSATGGVNFLSLFETKIEAKSNWTWTDTDTRSRSADTSESASVTVGGPAYGYSGPTDIAVYYDVIYKTFLFVPVENAIYGLRGSVQSSSGKTISGKEVVLVANGVKHRTFTNSKGQYRFLGNISGELRLQVDSVEKQLPELTPGQAVNIVLP